MRSRIVPVIGMAALLTACGDKADDNNNEQTKSISGVVNSTDYTVPAKPSFLSSISDFLFGKETYAIGGSIVDTVVAVPFTPGSSMGPYLMTDKIEVPIDSAGQAFNLALPTHYDWVLLLVNSNATAKQDKVVAYVTMSASAVENLVGMPMSDASGDVDLGTVSKNPDNNEEVESSNMATTLAASFSLSATQLLDMAKTDDAYKNLINYYLNYDTTTGAYFAPTTRFNWEAPVSATLASTIGATVAPATAYDATSFKGYFIYMGYSQTKNSPTLAELCAGTTTLDFAPPADVTAGTSVYGPTGADGAVIPGWEVSNPDMCSAGSIASSITSDNVLTNYPQGGQNISGSIPSGWWQLKRGGATGTVVGEFDLGMMMPRDGANNITVPVPVPRLTTGGTSGNAITHIDVAWYIYDKASTSYVEVTDTSIISRNIYHSFVEIYNTGFLVKDLYYMPGDQAIDNVDTTVALNNTWVVPSVAAGAGEEQISEFILSYSMAGNQYSFSWKF